MTDQFAISTTDDLINASVQAAMDMALGLNQPQEDPLSIPEREFIALKLPRCLMFSEMFGRFIGIVFVKEPKLDLYESIKSGMPPKFLTVQEHTEMSRFIFENSESIKRYLQWYELRIKNIQLVTAVPELLPEPTEDMNSRMDLNDRATEDMESRLGIKPAILVMDTIGTSDIIRNSRDKFDKDDEIKETPDKNERSE